MKEIIDGCEPEYRFRAKQGDIVKMPCGATAIVTSWDIIATGHVKQVTIYPLTNWLHRIWLFWTNQTCYEDEAINTLTPLQTRS